MILYWFGLCDFTKRASSVIFLSLTGYGKSIPQWMNYLRFGIVLHGNLPDNQNTFLTVFC